MHGRNENLRNLYIIIHDKKIDLSLKKFRNFTKTKLFTKNGRINFFENILHIVFISELTIHKL